MKRLHEVLTPDAIRSFDQNGYYVFPAGSSPFTNDEADALHTELLGIHRRSLSEANHSSHNSSNSNSSTSHPSSTGAQQRDDVMHPNKVEFLTAQGALKLVKPNVFEFDMHAKSSATAVPKFHQFFRESMPTISSYLKAKVPTLSTLCTDPQLHMTLKLQTNTGGCFPWHYDNPSPPNKRLLTLAVYLTKDWTEAMGGEVQLLPFLGKPVTIPPAFHTVVLFRSDLLLHRVLPLDGTKKGARNPRCCFTVWIDGTDTNKDEEVNLRAKNLQESFVDVMKCSPIQRSLSRAVYDDIYKQALIDCFDKCSSCGGVSSSSKSKRAGRCEDEEDHSQLRPTTKEALISFKLHEAHTKPLLTNAQVATFVEYLRSKRQF